MSLNDWSLYAALLSSLLVGIFLGKMIQRSLTEAQFKRVIELLEERGAITPPPCPYTRVPPVHPGFKNAETIPLDWLAPEA